MSWTDDRSRRRITKLLGTVPVNGIRVEDFATTYRQRRTFETNMGAPAQPVGTIDDIPYNAVVITDGVHVYANLIDYDTYLEDLGRESEAGSALLLQFVHLHYSGIDRLINAYGAQRVDHHGGRVHAVMLEPAGVDNEAERIRNALSLAAAMRELVAEASIAHQRKFGSRIRVGVESGVTLAINSGRRGEPEPLFIGDAANLAAKIADGDEEGVAIGPRARTVLALGNRTLVTDSGMLLEEASYLPGEGERGLLSAFGTSHRVDAAFADFRRVELAQAGRPANFTFFRHSLPLSDVDFAQLTPSHSARQEMISIFADLSGFTRYVHDSIAAGQIAEVVSNLHVIRGELAAVLRDFGGRKVRFIGDCIHGVLAEGSQTSTQEMDTIRQAVRCAGAMRSSFELCQDLLPGITDLGLTIGIEYGATPITRLGLTGNRSVRCASSKAVTVSERMQRNCSDNETSLGENARSKAPAAVRNAFGWRGKIPGMDYFSALAFANALAAPAISRPAPVAAEPYAA